MGYLQCLLTLFVAINPKHCVAKDDEVRFIIWVFIDGGTLNMGRHTVFKSRIYFCVFTKNSFSMQHIMKRLTAI